ncbi:hypothetical protein FGO68_gene14599 [Halteria grandinella]|uniref:Uncharacterized protein n=1 Tax=Halteria grandinella TaxID=5974 RepID=A0A8J8NGR3_HALGN|nr:hypothetical protein FGO68_gene14599 [Halteria grandinella]
MDSSDRPHGGSLPCSEFGLDQSRHFPVSFAGTALDILPNRRGQSSEMRNSRKSNPHAIPQTGRGLPSDNVSDRICEMNMSCQNRPNRQNYEPSQKANEWPANHTIHFQPTDKQGC